VARARANGIELEYDVVGNPADPPVLLIMGLGAQMIAWDDEFVLALARRGHFVVRFDNRDVGLSTHFHDAPAPPAPVVIARRNAGEPLGVPYLLDDMAADTAELLAHLDLASAHVVGASMGGMIAQALAIREPERVRSLVSIMSTTGHPGLPTAKPEAMARFAIPVPTEREAYVEHSLASQRVFAGSGFPFEEERARRNAGRAFDRAFDPAGVARQAAAVIGSGSRRDALAELELPALVIHGLEDPLVPVEGGLDTHQAIAGSELLLIDGMGHSLPRGTWPAVIDAIQKLVARAS
jgi:pimeloyl-ACP methyl ester carboxylesterase